MPWLMTRDLSHPPARPPVWPASSTHPRSLKPPPLAPSTSLFAYGLQRYPPSCPPDNRTLVCRS
eukprot:6178276-Pleurochrysis_carterae.AAC.2